MEEPVDADESHVLLQILLVGSSEIVDSSLFLNKRFENADPSDVLANLLHQCGVGSLKDLEAMVDNATKCKHEQGQDWQGEHGIQGESWIDGDHDAHRNGDDEQRVDDGQKSKATGSLDSVDVIGGMGHQIARLLLIVERRGEAQVVVVQFGP